MNKTKEDLPMAFNLKVFQTRTLTAVVFVLVMLAGLLINHWTFFLLFSVIHFGCWIEYQRLIGAIDVDYLQVTPFHRYGIMIAGWCIMLWFTGPEFSLFGVRLHQIGWWLGLIFLFLLPVMEILFTRNIQLKNIVYSVIGILYISLSMGLMMDLYSIGTNPRNLTTGIDFSDSFYGLPPYFLPAAIIATLWINDTMAYIIGSLIGRTPISSISPKKTWEGTAGGIILSVGVVWFIAIFILKLESLGIWLGVLAFIASVIGTMGDFLESKLKRMAGVKDSGQVMPGHGGFLDRFDSLLLATPFVWIYVYLFMY